MRFFENPVKKLKTASWKNIISQQENYFFSVGKSFFSSRAILDTFFRFVFELFWAVFVHFDTNVRFVGNSKNSWQSALSNEQWVFDWTKGHKLKESSDAARKCPYISFLHAYAVNKSSPLKCSISSQKSQCGAPIKSPHCIRSRTALSLPTHRIAFFRSLYKNGAQTYIKVVRHSDVVM